MATTTLLQRHAGEGETIAEAIRDCLDYGKDPEKTESGKYISAYNSKNSVLIFYICKKMMQFFSEP